MIYSDKQYGITRRELAKLQDALVAIQDDISSEDWVHEITIDGLQSQIAELEADIAYYDLLKSGEISTGVVQSLEALPSALIQARIASGMSQSELARELGLKPQQVQRYEASEYLGANLARLIQVSKTLNVHMAGLFQTEAKEKGAVLIWNEFDDVAWQQFPVQEMVKRRWFDVPHGTDPIDRVQDYILNKTGSGFTTAFHRKKLRGASLPNEYALLAWQARILDRAQTMVETGGIAEFQYDERWIPELVALTSQSDGPRRARALLALHGIVLVTEKHLPGTYLDGAAMIGNSDNPVIGLTLRYDRLDNFWFVLFHELGHVYLHLFDGLHFDFFDDDESKSNDRIELEADQFALDKLIPHERWEKCLSRFALSEASVRIDAKNLGVDVSIIAGRIRRELGNYKILSDLVGNRQVRIQLEQAANGLE